MRAGPRPEGAPQGPPPGLTVRRARLGAELGRAALVRAWTLKRYPPGREFSVRLDRANIARTEGARLEELYAGQADAFCPREACLVASIADEGIAAELREDAEPGGQGELVDADGSAIVGTLDVSLEAYGGGASVEGDQHLFPSESGLPAYISSMGVVGAARRRGVASALLEEARVAAADLGAAGLFVVTMAVNERARALYSSLGFELVKEESVNLAARRGGCLDGQDGKARTVLLVDPAFRPKE